MATKKSTGGQRMHYDYAVTGTVPGVGSVSGSKSPSNGQNYKKGGRAKPAKRGR